VSAAGKAVKGGAEVVESALKSVQRALDMSPQARMRRADEMFPASAYHGTAADIREFRPDGSVTKARSAKGVTWASGTSDTAGGYARLAAEDKPVQDLIDASYAAERKGNWDEANRLMAEAEKLEQSGELVGAGGQNVMPIRIDDSNFRVIDADGATMSDLDDSQLYSWVEEAKADGYDGLKILNFSDNADWGSYKPDTHYAVFDQSKIRSVNAAFDPAMRDSPNLLASNAAQAALAGGAVAGGAALAPQEAEAGVVTPGAGMAAMDPEAEAEIDRRITGRIRASQYNRRKRAREGRFAGLRESLLAGIGDVTANLTNAMTPGAIIESLDQINRAGMGVAAGFGDLRNNPQASLESAVQTGMATYQQPAEQTAYDAGAAVQDFAADQGAPVPVSSALGAVAKAMAEVMSP
jgi:hypothetical protein